MPLLTFPPTPSNGQLYPTSPSPGQSQYRWSSAEQTWMLEGTATSVVPGTYGDASTVPQITVDAQGRLTAVVGVPTNAPEIVAVPASSADPGAVGQVAFGTGLFYWHDGTQWLQVAGSTF